MIYQKYLKRILDLILASIILITTSLVIIFVSLVLFFLNKGHVFFLQPRPGKNEKIFYIIKFKTMNDSCDKDGNLLPDFKRLTIFGKFIRKTSIDELPQLINVVKGDMSLVGPRPLLIDYLPRYNDFQKRRHDVRPGITGWAQVNGRNTINWQQKFEHDAWYVNNLSFLLDFKILLLTLKKIIISEGVNSSSTVTMEEFKGND